jgi:hypothetical protein
LEGLERNEAEEIPGPSTNVEGAVIGPKNPLSHLLTNHHPLDYSKKTTRWALKKTPAGDR